MKRIKCIGILGACVMLAGSLPAYAADHTDSVQTQEILAGDINHDGDVNIQDLMLCLNHVSQKALLTGNELSVADVDESGNVNIQDLMLLLNYVSGKSDVKLGHNYELTRSEKATCTKEGYEEYTCTRCGDSYKITLPKIEHTYKLTKTVEPTCTEDGYKVYTCEVCGEIKNEATEKALGHDIKTVVDHKNSTCTVKGYDIYKCSRCDETQKVELDLVAHDYDKTVEVNRVESTCATKGYVEYKCKNCDDILREELPLDSSKHNYVLTGSDLTYNYYQCSGCGNSYQEYNDKEYTIDLGNGQTTTVVGHYDVAMAQRIGELVNERRTKWGLKTLNVYTDTSEPIGEAALIRGPELAVKYDHIRPNGKKSIVSFVSFAGTMGENIAKGQESAEQVFKDWCNSPGHDANQTSDRYYKMGVAVFVVKTQFGDYTYHSVQLFG